MHVQHTSNERVEWVPCKALSTVVMFDTSMTCFNCQQLKQITNTAIRPKMPDPKFFYLATNTSKDWCA